MTVSLIIHTVTLAMIAAHAVLGMMEYNPGFLEPFIIVAITIALLMILFQIIGSIIRRLMNR